MRLGQLREGVRAAHPGEIWILLPVLQLLPHDGADLGRLFIV